MTGPREETLYRMMYESFTPRMMHFTPLWVKRRIAKCLRYRLVKTMKTDDFMRKLFTTPKDELAPMSFQMFDDSCGGATIKPFFWPPNWFRTARRIWRGETHTPEQLRLLQKITSPRRFEPGTGHATEAIRPTFAESTRRRLLR